MNFKKLTCLALAALMLLCAVGCAKKFYSGINYSDYVTVGEYKGVTVKQDDIDGAMAELRSNIISANTVTEDVTDRGAEAGDNVIIDYTVTVDGNKIDALGATGIYVEPDEENENLRFVELPSLVKDKKAKDTFSFTTRLTADDKKEGVEIETDGKEATVDVTVTAVKHTTAPEDVTDEMAKEYTGGVYETYAEYKKAYKYEVTQTYALDAVYEGSTILQYPKDEAEEYFKILYNNENYMMQAQYGFTLEDLGETYINSISKSLVEQARTQTIRDLICLSIFDKEGFSYTEEDLNAFIEEQATAAGSESTDEYVSAMGEDRIAISMKVSVVTKFLADNCVISED